MVFSGAGSLDADHDEVTYTWELVSRPAASAAVLGATDKYQAGLHSRGFQVHQVNFINRPPPPPPH